MLEEKNGSNTEYTLSTEENTEATVSAETTEVSMPEIPAEENFWLGVVGALLCSLVGGVLYFILYQFGYIAGICGLVAVALAIFGYQKFSGVKNSLKGVIAAVVVAVLMLAAAEYLCVSYVIYDVYKELVDITFFDAVRATPEFLFDPELGLLWECAKDLLIAYALGALASFKNIRDAVVKAKESKEQTL